VSNPTASSLGHPSATPHLTPSTIKPTLSLPRAAAEYIPYVGTPSSGDVTPRTASSPRPRRPSAAGTPACPPSSVRRIASRRRSSLGNTTSSVRRITSRRRSSLGNTTGRAICGRWASSHTRCYAATPPSMARTTTRFTMPSIECLLQVG
jgi:hypothetical protein